MKQIRLWISVLAIAVFVIDWGVLGVKLFNGNYDVTVETYIGAVALVVLLLCAVSKLFTDKCPHCGKLRISNGKFCPYCGKEIEK